MSSLRGLTLSGRYRLEERIGSGGMATVYRALDQTLERPVAVKVMKAEVASDSDQLERFRREARAVAQLSHANVVGVIDAGEDDGHPYIVFEYVEGETLKQRIREQGALPITDALSYAAEIASALAAAHARHIVHRDIKPQNVLIDKRGSARVTDFGIARTLDERGLTADGRVLGTTDYVSPEQALGLEVTGQSDLYSLGIVLYEMLTGELPFNGEAQVAVAMKHVHEPLPDVRARRPEVSPQLAAIVSDATAKRIEDRYASDDELIADLEGELTRARERRGQGDEITAELQALDADADAHDDHAARRRGRRPRLPAISPQTPAAAGWGAPEVSDRDRDRRDVSDGRGARDASGRNTRDAVARDARDTRDTAVRHARTVGPRHPPAGAEHQTAVPASGRRRHGRSLAAGGLVLAAVVAAALLVAARSPSGKRHSSPDPGTPGARIAICASCAAAYNPDGHGGTAQNNSIAYRAVDGNTSSGWVTQQYYDGTLNKPGVGIYVTVPSGTRASWLKLYTSTPGFKARIYATNRQPDATSFTGSGWTPLSGSVTAANGGTIRLSSTSAGYRHYLLWITQLPPGHELAAVNEIELYRG